MTASPASGLATRGRGAWQSVLRSRPWRTVSHFTNVGGSVLSSGMSYQALFAVFAGLVVGFGVLGIVLKTHPDLLAVLVEQINLFVPGLLGYDEHSAVNVDSLLRTRALQWTSIVAAVSLLWVSINWFTGTRRSIRLIFGLEVKQYRNAALLKVRDLVLALVFFLAVIASAVLTIVSSNLSELVLGWLGVSEDNWFFGGLGLLARYGAMYVLDVLILIAIHRYLAEVRVGWWNLVTGCMLGGAALFGLKLLGTTLLSGAGSNAAVATFAIFVGLLLWFNFVCRAVLLTSSWIATGLDPELGAPGAPGTQELPF